MKLTRESLAQIAGWTDDQKADVMSLFDSIAGKDKEIETLKAKAPSDSQKVIESVDYDKLVAAQTERDELARKLREKLESANVETVDPMEAFNAFFGLFN